MLGRALPMLASLALVSLGCSPEVTVFGATGGGAGGASCAPELETCDGLDNDCDGEIDEGCSCDPGQTEACYSGDPGTVGLGQCVEGIQTCTSQGIWGPCEGEVTASPETCDGSDEDCDGEVDEDLGTETCGVGACMVTVSTCAGGMPATCVPAPPGTEVCDGIDNNCDGGVDESDPSVGTSCMTGQPGACGVGVWQCDAGTLSCVQSVTPQPEACDGVDNNCNGQTDEGNPGGGASCGTGQPGVCAAGTMQCTGGMLSCVSDQPAQAEVCDGLDNDCDGQIDAGPCGCGGTASCVGGQLVCSGGATVYFEETFSGNGAGWTLGNTWAIGPTSVSSGQSYGNPDPALDHTPTGDNMVAGVVLGGNAPTNQHNYYYLTSPVIDTSVAGPVFLRYYRWLNSDYAPWMENRVQVYDGSAWVTLWQSGDQPGVQDSAWQIVTFDITAHKNAALQIRFGYQIGQNGTFLVSSWNVDDVLVSNAACP